jgi:putative MFS transporter
MAAEELPAKARGFGLGWLAMNAALGVGLGAILYGGVFESAGISWRWLYVVGLPPLVGIGFLRRRLPESRRFISARDGGRLADRWHAIIRRPHRRWLVLIVVTSALIELMTQAGTFAIDYLQTDRGLSQSASNFMLVGAGLPGIPIMIYAGALSDRHGRRVVGVGFSIMSLIGAMGFFWGPGGVPSLLAFMMLMIVGSLGAWPTLGAYTSELFPTALRGQAASWATCARVAGQSGSFALGGLLLAATDSFPTTVSVLAIGPLIAIVIIAIVFPDTHGRELEDISGEDVGPLTIGTVPL